MTDARLLRWNGVNALDNKFSSAGWRKEDKPCQDENTEDAKTTFFIIEHTKNYAIFS